MPGGPEGPPAGRRRQVASASLRSVRAMASACLRPDPSFARACPSCRAWRPRRPSPSSFGHLAVLLEQPVDIFDRDARTRRDALLARGLQKVGVAALLRVIDEMIARWRLTTCRRDWPKLSWSLILATPGSMPMMPPMPPSFSICRQLLRGSFRSKRPCASSRPSWPPAPCRYSGLLSRPD